MQVGPAVRDDSGAYPVVGQSARSTSIWLGNYPMLESESPRFPSAVESPKIALMAGHGRKSQEERHGPIDL
jgi:hypothetical protein